MQQPTTASLGFVALGTAAVYSAPFFPPAALLIIVAGIGAIATQR